MASMVKALQSYNNVLDSVQGPNLGEQVQQEGRAKEVIAEEEPDRQGQKEEMDEEDLDRLLNAHEHIGEKTKFRRLGRGLRSIKKIGGVSGL